MKLLVFIESQDRRLKVISVLEKHGIVLRWNSNRSYESNGINGSSRKNGNTAIIIGKVFDELNKEGIET